MATKMESFSFEAGDTEDPAIEVIPTPQFEEDPEEFAEKPSRTSVVAGCGLLVWALAGPFLALLAAIGGAYAAERNKGPFGESCKTVGHIAGAIAEVANEKAREMYLMYTMKAASRKKKESFNSEY